MVFVMETCNNVDAIASFRLRPRYTKNIFDAQIHSCVVHKIEALISSVSLHDEGSIEHPLTNRSL